MYWILYATFQGFELVLSQASEYVPMIMAIPKIALFVYLMCVADDDVYSTIMSYIVGQTTMKLQKEDSVQEPTTPPRDDNLSLDHGSYSPIMDVGNSTMASKRTSMISNETMDHYHDLPAMLKGP